MQKNHLPHIKNQHKKQIDRDCQKKFMDFTVKDF